jgi:hypothetical protein
MLSKEPRLSADALMVEVAGRSGEPENGSAAEEKNSVGFGFRAMRIGVFTPAFEAVFEPISWLISVLSS